MIKAPWILLGLAATALTACQDGQVQGSGDPLAQGRSAFLADQSDPCFPERQAMSQGGAKIEGAFDGVLDVGYAVGGVLESIRQTGSVGGTLGSGGVTVSGGYIEALRNENGTILSLLSNASRDVEAENARIDQVLAAFEQLSACRKAGAEAIRADYLAGKFQRADAEGAMAALRAAYRADIDRFRVISQQISKNTQTYADVYNDIADDNDVDGIEVGPYRRENVDKGRPSAKVVKRRTTPRKRVTPKGTLTAAPSAPPVRPEVQRLQNQLLTNVRKRDEVISRVEDAEAESNDLDLALGPLAPGAVVPT